MDLNFDRSLDALGEKFSDLEDLPLELWHCLDTARARIALLFATHKTHDYFYRYNLHFVGDRESAVVSTRFGYELTTTTVPFINVSLTGEWFLKAEEHDETVALGAGNLSIEGIKDFHKTRDDLSLQIGERQVGYVMLVDEAKVSAASSAYGRVFVDQDSLTSFLSSTAPTDSIVLTFEKPIPTKPGYSKGANQNMYGEVFSVGASAVSFTNARSFRFPNQGTGKVYLALSGSPLNKMELAKYLKDLTGLSISEITANFSDKSGTPWVFHSSEDLKEVGQIYRDVRAFGCNVEILNKQA